MNLVFWWATKNLKKIGEPKLDEPDLGKPKKERGVGGFCLIQVHLFSVHGLFLFQSTREPKLGEQDLGEA